MVPKLLLVFLYKNIMIEMNLNNKRCIDYMGMLLRSCIDYQYIVVLITWVLTQKGITYHPNELLCRWFAFSSHHTSSLKKEMGYYEHIR